MGDTAPVTEETTDETTPPETIEDPAAVLEMARKKDRENLGLKAKVREQDAELLRLREFETATQTEFEKAVAKARTDEREIVEGEYKGRILSERVLGRAASVLADPEDAVKFLDLSVLDPDDPKTIDEALADLLESKPYLARTEASKKKQKIDQGPKGKTVTPPDVASGDEWLRGVLGGGPPKREL